MKLRTSLTFFGWYVQKTCFSEIKNPYLRLENGDKKTLFFYKLSLWSSKHQAFGKRLHRTLMNCALEPKNWKNFPCLAQCLSPTPIINCYSQVQRFAWPQNAKKNLIIIDIRQVCSLFKTLLVLTARTLTPISGTWRCNLAGNKSIAQYRAACAKPLLEFTERVTKATLISQRRTSGGKAVDNLMWKGRLKVKPGISKI